MEVVAEFEKGAQPTGATVYSPATSEVSDDSEADSILFAPCFAAADDEDDAESCIGGGGYCSDDEEPGRGITNDQCRLMSWRSWLMQPAALEEGETCDSWDDQEAAANSGKDHLMAPAPAPAKKDKMAVEETDRSNRLFWEGCLASGY